MRKQQHEHGNGRRFKSRGRGSYFQVRINNRAQTAKLNLEESSIDKNSPWKYFLTLQEMVLGF
jgi:hypothetical protein